MGLRLVDGRRSCGLRRMFRRISRASRERMVEFMSTMEPEVAKTFVSTLDRMIAEGRDEAVAVVRAEGRSEGRAEGRAELFAGLLAFKFGDLDEDVQAAVRAASTEQITAWSTRLIEGTLTLDDVTG